MKKLSGTILTGAAFALLLVGCQQDDPDPRTSDAGSSIINEDARTSQAPARDPSFPAADPYNQPEGTGTTGTGTTGAGTTGMDSAGAGTTGTGTDPEARISGNQDSSAQDSSADRDQTSPGTLTQEEERNDMPLPGQNSDHSTPNPDQTSSR